MSLTPPRNKEVEDILIGTLLTNFEAVPVCLPRLTFDSFYAGNGDIFRAIRRDYDENGDVDYVRVEHRLKQDFGEDHPLPSEMELMRNSAPPDKAEEYCDILNDLASRRNIQSFVQTDILDDIHSITAQEVITRLEKIKHENIDNLSIPGLTYSEILARDESVDRAEQLYTGIRFFDERFFGEDGSRRGGILVPFGDSGHGKTEFCVWLTARYLEQGYKGVFCIRESKDRKVADRVYKNLRDKDNIDNLIIADVQQGLNNLGDMEATVKYHNAVSDIDFFIFDHLKIIPVEGLNDWEENKRITTCVNRGMYLSQEVDALGILASQVNRATINQSRGWQKDPDLNNLYGSSAIEQSASMAVSIFRPREVEELIDHYQDGTPRAVKSANYDYDQKTFDLNSVFIKQKKIRDGEKYQPFVRFVHTDNGFEFKTEKKPF